MKTYKHKTNGSNMTYKDGCMRIENLVIEGEPNLDYWEEIVENNVVFDTYGKSYYHKQSNDKWRCHGEYNQANPIDTIEYTIKDSEIGKTRYVIKQGAIKSKILFRSEDGVDIFKDDTYYSVLLSDLTYTENRNNCATKEKYYKCFSTKEAAENYIKMNKPCLSFKEIAPLIGQCNESTYINLDRLTEKIKKLVKTKL